MFLIPRLLVGLTFFFLCLTKCLAFPMEDAVDARFLHARQVATSATMTNILTTAKNISASATSTLTTANSTSATAAAANKGGVVADQIVPAVAHKKSKSSASLATATANTNASSVARPNFAESLVLASASREAKYLAAAASASGNGSLVILVNETCASSTSAAASATTTAESFVTVTILQPSLCTASYLQYSTTTAIPTGYVQILPDNSAYWGNTGSIWNFTLDDGVQFSNLTANCQGSLCSEYGTQDEVSGSIVKNPDGVWTLNVTANMQQAVTIFGVTTGGDPVNGTFDFSITSTPPCALPVAESCDPSTFNPSADQWAAYSTDQWLATYVSDKDIETFGDLYDTITAEFVTPETQGSFVCEPDADEYHCIPPSSTPTDCATMQGYLVLWGIMRISNALNMLIGTFTTVKTDVYGFIADFIVDWIVPVVQQDWEAIVTAVSSIVGILIFIFILIDVLSADTASPATGVAVGLIVGTTNVIGSVANFANGFFAKPPSDTYLVYEGEYDDFADSWGAYVKAQTLELWRPTSNSTAFGAAAVQGGLKGGAWTNELDPFQTPGLSLVTETFFDTLVITTVINDIWKSNGWYIAFVPYGEIGSFQSGRIYVTPTSNTSFSMDDCMDHWWNNPNRANYVTCTLNYGGTPGMTILAQASSSKGGTLPDTTKEWSTSVVNFTFSYEDALQSSLTANALYGFDYNYTNGQLYDTLYDGSFDISAEFVIALDTPGLYNIDVCIITDFSMIPGSQEYLKSGNGNINTDSVFLDPCVCAQFTSHGTSFVDSAPSKIVDAVNSTSCLRSGRLA